MYRGGQIVLGKRVNSLASEDLSVDDDGNVTGTLYYVKSYLQFSNVEAEQSGHYFPIKLNTTGTSLEISKNGQIVKNVDFDNSLVLRIEKNSDTFEIKVDSEPYITFKFEKVRLEEK